MSFSLWVRHEAVVETKGFIQGTAQTRSPQIVGRPTPTDGAPGLQPVVVRGKLHGVMGRDCWPFERAQSTRPDPKRSFGDRRK